MKGGLCSLPFKSFILLPVIEYMPDDPGQLFGDHGSGYLPPASSFNLAIKSFNRFVVGISANSSLSKSQSQIFIPILIAGLMSAGSPTVITSWDQAAIAGKLL